PWTSSGSGTRHRHRLCRPIRPRHGHDGVACQVWCLEEDALLTPCCGGPDTLLCGEDGGNLCENPSARLFWDGAHPTEAAYHYMAHLLLRSIDDTTVRGASYTSL
uniref:GDSL esterase/lipase n=1 Tax=Aegilops tauschii subsp. strangulata TaxID=200361 RepID=A0A453L8C2_AEGTS